MDKENTHMPEGKAIHSDQMCSEKATLQVTPSSLAAESPEVLHSMLFS